VNAWARHGGEIALPDFLPDDDAAGTYILAEISRECQPHSQRLAAPQVGQPIDRVLLS
jgi:hypothetical protein